MITTDLHLHTNFSDGLCTLEKIIDLCGRSGMDAIAITDHLCSTQNIWGKSARILGRTLTYDAWKDYMREIEKHKNRAWRDYKMIVFGGIEFTHNTFSHQRNCHMLAIDVKDFISPDLSEVEWLKEARQQGAMTVAAHPMKVLDAKSQTYYLLANREKFEGLFDAWEVANTRTFFRDMLKYPYSLIATSDLRSPQKWAAWRTQIDCEKDPEAIKGFFKKREAYRRFVFLSGRTDEIDHKIDPSQYRLREAL